MLWRLKFIVPYIDFMRACRELNMFAYLVQRAWDKLVRDIPLLLGYVWNSWWYDILNDIRHFFSHCFFPLRRAVQRTSSSFLFVKHGSEQSEFVHMTTSRRTISLEFPAILLASHVRKYMKRGCLPKRGGENVSEDILLIGWNERPPPTTWNMYECIFHVIMNINHTEGIHA